MVQMEKTRFFVHWTSRIAALVLAANLSGCGSEKQPITASSGQYEVADEDSGGGQVSAAGAPAEALPDNAGAPQPETTRPVQPSPPAQPVAKPPAIAEADLDAGAAPSGGPDELAAQLEELDDSLKRLGAPRGADSMAQQVWLMQAESVFRAKRDTASKLLAKKDLAPEIERAARVAQLEASSGLVAAGAASQEDAQALQDDSEKMAKEPDADLARLGKLGLVLCRLRRLAAGEDEDAKAVVQDLRQLLANGGGAAAEFTNLQIAMASLLRAGDLETGIEVMKAIGEGYEKHPDESLAGSAADLLQQVKMLDFQNKLMAVVRKQPDSLPVLLQSAKDLLADGADAGALGLLSQGALNLEFSGDLQAAGQLYELVRTSFADHSEQRLADYAKQILNGYDRRAALIGAPLKVEGVLADGEPLDWSQYEGKIVLIDFWATWCGPCLAELPNLKENYKRFHDRGFEIIGVNLDDQVEPVQQFLQKEKLPWVTVFSADAGAAGFRNPMAVKCGVEAIPFLVLIGRDGNVLALHVRGEQLGVRLEELIGQAAGPAADPGSAKSPEKPQ